MKTVYLLYFSSKSKHCYEEFRLVFLLRVVLNNPCYISSEQVIGIALFFARSFPFFELWYEVLKSMISHLLFRFEVVCKSSFDILH